MEFQALKESNAEAGDLRMSWLKTTKAYKIFLNVAEILIV